MKTTKFTCLALLILTLPAARGEPFRTDINPALLYYQAFLLAPELMSNADEEYSWSKAGREQKLPERFGKIVVGYDNQFKLVREAAQQKVPCDWGIDMSPGPATQLPHLARAKAVAQAARVRAIWDLQHGNQTGARDDLLAAVVLGRNVSRDGTLIGALVQAAIEALEYSAVAENFGQFSPETLKQLVAGFDAAPARGTMATAIMTEKLNHVDWVANKIRKLQRENPGTDTNVMAAIREDDELRNFEQYGGDVKWGPNFWQRVFVASGGTSDGILKLVRESEPLYLRLAKIMTLPLPEYEDQIQKFAAEIQKSQNPLVTVLFPNPLGPVGGPRRREFREQAELAMVRAAVEYKLHGESGLKSVMDPLGNGPFAFQRFVFEGVDRGFELKSAYTGNGYPYALIFVEKEGPPFYIEGGPQRIGKAVKP